MHEYDAYYNNEELQFRQRRENLLMDAASYVLAFEDEKFLSSPEGRTYRMQLEAVKPETIFRLQHIESTIIVFGSARFLPGDVAQNYLRAVEEQLAANPDDQGLQRKLRDAQCRVKFSKYYDMAREFAQIASKFSQQATPRSGYRRHDFIVCTGGGPGIMEAANRGAHDVDAMSIGLNIMLPYEQKPNPYISNEFCFQFHYFAIRKLHFMLRAKAMVAFPGGFGTFDELFEGLTLRQTQRMQQLPIILFSEEFWRNCINFDYLIESGVISPEDIHLFTFVETPQQAWDAIVDYHKARNDPVFM